MSSIADPAKYLKRIIPVIVCGLLLVFYLLDPVESALFPRCPFNQLTGWYCPGCGSQRAIHSFLHFSFRDAIAYNFLVFPAALLILYHYMHGWLNRIFRWNLPNVLYMKSTPWIILAVVIGFWIIRNIPVEPFNWFAPGGLVR
jgi:hypothetical protein